MRRLLPTGAALLLSACMGPMLEGRPRALPAPDEGMALYSVGRLAFEAPADWEARGDGRHVRLEPGDGSALLDVRVLDRRFASEDECLAQAEDALARGSGDLRDVRRHPTTFAGRRGVAQEADQGRWHGFAFAVCDGGVQYRVYLVGASPLSQQVTDAYQALLATTEIGDEQ